MFFEQLTETRRQGVTAVETTADRTIYYFHDGDGFRTEEEPFKPFILLSSPEQLSQFEGAFSPTPLGGDMTFKLMASFPDVKTYEAAQKYLKKTPNGPWTFFRDLSQQALLEGKSRLFSGMEFSELRRLSFDLETLTTPGYDFPNSDREGDEIVIISMRDSTGFELVLSQEDMSEKELIQAFVKTLAERDPDVIEGHNLCRFDLPYLEARARRHKVKLALGRDGSIFSKRSSRFNIADRIINYSRYDVWGRHVVDTLHLAMLYDGANRNLESYNLKYLAKHFRIASDERTYVDGSKITELWNSDRATLLAYALDDVRETEALSAVLSPSYFYQTQLLPLKYQNVIIRGNGTSLDALLTCEYLRKRHSLPLPEAPRRFSGALTRADATGIFRNVWHCDVRSLYPSIILAEKWVPSRDELGEFPRLLGALRTFRLAAKDAARTAEDPAKKKYFQALQSTFKITINSFYGYLGFSQGTFNDFDMAERVTARGREILTMMLDFLTGAGAKVLEMDTDGIYFQPPAGVGKPAEFGRKIQEILPAGIEVELDSVYDAMFSYKSKNYALLSPDGVVSITGAALKSRGLEPFQRRFMAEMIDALLRDDRAAIPRAYDRIRRSIESREIPLADLAKTETLNDSPETYKRKLAAGTGRRAAAFELAIRSERDYQSGDQVTYYITGEKKKVSAVDNAKLLADAPEGERDENTAYYLNKLDELYRNFESFILPQK
ncbi:DNA polymerase domain-containing protein [Victivallis vadensis]|uniref:DNA polymerase domain-containing protein n=1 Tax=Victivallis vadensis TaxID=172901 RepID=UPI003AF689D9